MKGALRYVVRATTQTHKAHSQLARGHARAGGAGHTSWAHDGKSKNKNKSRNTAARALRSILRAPHTERRACGACVRGSCEPAIYKHARVYACVCCSYRTERAHERKKKNGDTHTHTQIRERSSPSEPVQLEVSYIRRNTPDPSIKPFISSFIYTYPHIEKDRSKFCQ